MSENCLLNRYLRADAYQLLKYLPHNFVDLILIDPPYNIAGKKRSLTKVGNKWMTNKQAWGNDFVDDLPEEELLMNFCVLANLFYDILVDGGSLLTFFDRGKPHLLQPFYDVFTPMNKITFCKNNPLPHKAKTNYRSGTEDCFWFCKGEKPHHFNFLEQDEMINYKIGNIGQKETKHPTEKYRWMIEPLVRVHSNEGDVVLDCFGGSATTAVICNELDRKWISCEISRKLWKMGRCRLLHELKSGFEEEGTMLSL